MTCKMNFACRHAAIPSVALVGIALLAGCNRREQTSTDQKDDTRAGNAAILDELAGRDLPGELVCRLVPIRRRGDEGPRYTATPVVFCAMTETLDTSVADVIGDAQASPSVKAAAKFVSAVAREDEKLIAELAAPSNGLGFKNPASGVRAMLGELDAAKVQIQGCVYVGGHAYVSMRSDPDRPSNALIPVQLESGLVDLSALVGDAGQFLSQFEFAIAANPECGRTVSLDDFTRCEFIGKAFSDEGEAEVPLFVVNAVRIDEGETDDQVGKAVADYSQTWSSLASGDDEGFASGLNPDAARYFQGNREPQEKLDAFVRMVTGERKVTMAGRVDDTVVLLADWTKPGESAATERVADLMFDNGEGNYQLGTLRFIQSPFSSLLASAIE